MIYSILLTTCNTNRYQRLGALEEDLAQHVPNMAKNPPHPAPPLVGKNAPERHTAGQRQLASTGRIESMPRYNAHWSHHVAPSKLAAEVGGFTNIRLLIGFWKTSVSRWSQTSNILSTEAIPSSNQV